ncbi:MAG: diguanylate cyclase [Clostridiales bacterium]|nr:diguanylate cyclase [Clostridiales bacterium]
MNKKSSSVNNNYSFNTLFDIKRIQKLQDAFSEATGVASIITMPDGRPITEPSGFSSLCIDVIRKTELGCKNCMASDAKLGSPRKDGPRVQPCLSAGLIDGGASIMIGDKHIANWLIGQVLDSEIDIGVMLKYADEIGADRDEYEKALKKVTRMTKDKFSQITEFLFINASMLSELAVKNAEQLKEIEARKRIEQQLANEKETFRVTIQSIGDAVITTDAKGIITSMNGMAETLTAWKQEEAIGLKLNTVLNIISGKNRKKLKNPVGTVLKTGGIKSSGNKTILISKDGIERYIADNGAPIMDAEGNILGVVIVFRNVTNEILHQEKILYMNKHDSLTGLYNREYFEKELKKADKADNLPVSIIFGDVNGLKITNDIFGHNAGDRLLKNISRIIEKSCRNSDIIARLGGDEFSVILPKTDYATANEICSKIKMNCVEFKGNKPEMLPSIALGLDTKEDNTQDLSGVSKKAEDRMYRNKLLESKSKKSGTVSSLQRTLHEKSFETKEHATRMIELSRHMGEAIGLHENELDDLELLATLHDIGKVAISDTILTKPGKLDKEEWEEMKKHSEIGFRIAQSSLELSHISELILCHHERWDGKGYPTGRCAEEIPLLSRIISLVDSYDVMTNARPYKDKISMRDALTEIADCSGTQFDPSLVNVFLGMMAKTV